MVFLMFVSLLGSLAEWKIRIARGNARKTVAVAMLHQVIAL